MNYQEKYQQSLKAGYSPEEVMDFLSQKDPSFSEKMKESVDAGYSPEEIMSFFGSSSKDKEPEAADYVKDFGQQAAQGAGIGALGTYGDILDLLGVQAKEKLPGQEQREEAELSTLEKLKKNEVPSLYELQELSEEPMFYRFPTSQGVEELGEMSGLVSEPKTVAGRYGRRIGKIGGSGASLGTFNLAAPIAAGIAGQTLEEAGAPPWAQAAAEIIATLKYSPKPSTPITSRSPNVKKTIDELRKAGYSEQDITLAKNALEERGLLKKYSTMTPEAENAIQRGVKNSEELFEAQVKKGLPGYAEGGLPYLEKQASNVYQKMEELAATVPIKNTEPVRKSIQKSIDYLEKYPLLKEQKEFIEFLKEGLEKSKNANTAEFFTGFYRNLGKAGKWGNPTQKEHILGLVKQGIKDTFEQSGNEAARFGKYFEKTNEAWKKWLDAKDLMTTLEKAQTPSGVNFKKVASIFEDKKTHELATKVLGKEQVDNIQTIIKGSQAIESLLTQIPKSDKNIQTIKFLGAIGSLFSGNYKPLAALVGVEAAKRYATDILINPEKQNRMKKIIVAAQNSAPQQAAILSQELMKTEFSPAKEEKK